MAASTTLLLLALTIITGASTWELKQVTEPLNHVEGPHWDADQNVLYYTDILGQLVLRYDPATGKRTQVYIADGYVSPVLRVEGTSDGFVIGRTRDLVTFRWDGNSSQPEDVRVLTSVEGDKPLNKFNDGKADTRGRIWAGTIENDGLQGNAAFYFFQRDQNYTAVKKLNATTSNGLAWTDDDKHLYYIDSPTGYVDLFDYDADTAEISNRRHFFTPGDFGLDGHPDGMTLDGNGDLWVALWDGNAVVHVNGSTGALIQKYELPANQVSSCVWGGANLDTLYVTTSRQNYNDDDIAKFPLAGSVFALTNTGIRGQKSNKVKL